MVSLGKAVKIGMLALALCLISVGGFATSMQSSIYQLETGDIEGINGTTDDAGNYMSANLSVSPFIYTPGFMYLTTILAANGSYFLPVIQPVTIPSGTVKGNQTISYYTGNQNSAVTSNVFISINGAAMMAIGSASMDGNGLWSYAWDTTIKVPTAAPVAIYAQVGDGLFLSPMQWLGTVNVDNESPSLNYVSVSPNVLSPANHDGVNDAVTISVRLQDTSTLNYSLRIYDGTTLKRTFVGTANPSVTINEYFDGRDSNGNILPDGVYSAVISGSDIVGNFYFYSLPHIILNTNGPSFVAGSVSAAPISTALNSSSGGISVTFSATSAIGLSADAPHFYLKLLARNGISDHSSGEFEYFPALDAAGNWNQTGGQILDSATYQVRIEVADTSGMTSSATTNVTTFDRTPPQINLPNGSILSSLTMSEDTTLNYVLDNVATDNGSQLSDLHWNVYVYNAGDPLGPDNGNLLKSVAIKSLAGIPGPAGATQYYGLTVVPMPDANTGPNIGGNIYGYTPGYIQLNLTDAAGNSVSQNIQISVTPVNDLPVIHGPIGAGVVTDAFGRVVYNIKLAEGQTGAGIRLDDFITDVDNLSSDWTITATHNVVPTQSVNVTFSISDSSVGHFTIINLNPYWYGDDTNSVFQISDGGTPVTVNFITRVTHVNHPPIISPEIPTSFIADEDTPLNLNLYPYEDDALNEDRVPTYHSQLNWTIVVPNSKKGTLVHSVSGENSLLDLIELLPESHKYGTCNVQLVLTDTDRIEPQKVFPDYTPNPLSTSINVTIGWRPVNHAPTVTLDTSPIGMHEDDGIPVQIDCTGQATDVEDSFEDLHWSVTSTRPDLVSATFDQTTNKITLNTQPNAWGTANILVAVTDSDTHIDYAGYVPNPKTTTVSILVKIKSQNDVPSISSATLVGTAGTIVGSSRLKSTDTISAVGIGYSDVGFVNGVRNASAVGDEYGPSSDSSLNFTQNSKNFLFNWLVNSVLVRGETPTSSVTSNFAINTNDFEGKTIKVDVAPYDGVDFGVTKSAEALINIPPSAVTLSVLPTNDIWVSVNRLALSWNAATDSEGDPISYRVKVVKTVTSASTPSISVDDSNAYYDSGWVDNPAFLSVPDSQTTYSDGTYYWTVFSGNKCTNGSYDSRAATSIKKFNVDTVAPTKPSADYIVTLPDLTGGDGTQTDQFQILYGERETMTAVWLETYNERRVTIDGAAQLVTSYNYSEIVPVENSPTWSYQLVFPAGSSTFNVWVLDRAGNRSVLASTIYVKEDYTPPAPPVISNMSLNGGVYTAISSSNVFTISGTKEADSSIWFGDSFASGYSGVTFNIDVVSQKPSADLVAVDRAGNISTAVPISVTFIIGDPSLTFNLDRTIVNRVTDTSLNQAKITFQSNRAVKSWAVTSGNQTIVSGNALSANVTQSATILASALQNGDNTLTLNVTDTAGNMAKRPFVITVKTEKPTIEVINANYVLSGGVWHVSLVGKMKAGETVLVNGSSQFVSQNVKQGGNLLWIYRNFDSTGIRQTLDLARTDITIRVVDSVSNESTLSYYVAARDFISIQSVSNSILAPYENLPENILRLQAMSVDHARISAPISIQSTVQSAYGNGAGRGIQIPENLRKSQYVIYGQRLSGDAVPTADLKSFHILANFPVSVSATTEISRVAALRFDPELKSWVAPSVNQTYNAETQTLQVELDQLGIWGLGELKPAGASVSDIRVYPNPWKPNAGNANTGSPDTGIVIDQLPINSKIRIYAYDGRLIRSVVPTDTSYTWDGKNESAEDVASGVYLIAIDANGSRRISKLTILR